MQAPVPAFRVSSDMDLAVPWVADDLLRLTREFGPWLKLANLFRTSSCSGLQRGRAQVRADSKIRKRGCRTTVIAFSPSIAGRRVGRPSNPRRSAGELERESPPRVMAESLKHFVLRSEARKLFRSFAKTARRLPTRCVRVRARACALVRQVHLSM